LAGKVLSSDAILNGAQPPSAVLAFSS